MRTELWMLVGLGAVLGTVTAAFLGDATGAVQCEQHTIGVELELANVERALGEYRDDHGDYPVSLDALAPYFGTGVVPRDYWRRDFEYRVPGAHGDYDLWTYGRDGAPGGIGEDQDTRAWELEPTDCGSTSQPAR